MNKWLSKLLMAFAEELERFEGDKTRLVQESIPGLSNELLPEWETELGIPEPGDELGATLDERRAAAHAKYVSKYDGQSSQFYIDYATNLGAVVTIQEYFGYSSIFRVDKNRVDRTPLEGVAGARLWGLGARFKWIVTVYDLGEVTLEYLQGRFERMKPAHTLIVWVII